LAALLGRFAVLSVLFPVLWFAPCSVLFPLRLPSLVGGRLPVVISSALSVRPVPVSFRFPFLSSGAGRVRGCFVHNFRSFGFSGSRSLAGAAASACASLAAAAAASGGSVLVGCAAGADRAVRSAVPSAVVFRAASFSAAALVARSVSFVRALSGSPSPVLCVFPGAPCPSGLRPSPSPSRCFCGLGSGSWASAALAFGLGVPVCVFGFPVPPAWGVSCSGSGLLSGGSLLFPPPSLF